MHFFRFHLLCYGLCLFLFSFGIAAQSVQPVPELSGRVTDLTNTLSPAQQQELEQRLAQFEKTKGSQIAVLIIASTEPETIEQYGIKVAEAWQPGRQGVDDGILFLIAKDDRKLRIEVGYGLEGVIPDAIANRVIDEIIVPYLRQGDFYAGINAGIERIVGLIDGEPLPPVTWQKPETDQPGLSFDWLPLIIFLLPVLSALKNLIGRLPAALLSGAAAGALGYFLIGFIGALVLAVFAFIFTIGAFNAIPASGLPGTAGKNRHGPIVYRGGRSGGGVFRGGGGRFGGGGASGSW